jgi:anti-sigma-K factor RskA
MTDMDPIGHERDCGDDVAAYALGALSEAEAEAFRRHLETCVVCRDELAVFEQVVNALPMSAPAYDPPPGLRRRVLRAVAEEPRPHTPRAARARPSVRLRRPAMAFGSAAVALAVAAVVVVLAVGSGSSHTRVVTAQVTGRGSASLRVSGGHNELVLHRFAAPPAGKIYEVWLQRGSGAPSPTKALFSVNAQGDAEVDVPGSLHGVSHVLVTPEPAGGSPHPTHAPVIAAALD